VHALAAPHEARSTRSAGTAPPGGGSSLGCQAAFAFTAPVGLVNPVTRTHVRLLGPCFKTGRRRHRPTRDRDASRASERHSLYEPAQLPAGSEARRRGARVGRSPPELHPRPRSSPSGSSREGLEKCCHRRHEPPHRVLADPERDGRTAR
jgi:hypothetical protein